jgi:NADPH-dependent 2,4-dienoyl-CoA reductase/sulfur reductase-like enzyme
MTSTDRLERPGLVDGGPDGPASSTPAEDSPRRPGRRPEGSPLATTVGRVLARRSTSLAPRILILGGGFAGVTTAMDLAKRCAGVLPVHVTLPVLDRLAQASSRRG